MFYNQRRLSYLFADLGFEESRKYFLMTQTDLDILYDTDNFVVVVMASQYLCTEHVSRSEQSLEMAVSMSKIGRKCL